MKVNTTLFGYSVHQILIVLPLGLLATAVTLDMSCCLQDAPDWSLPYWVMAAGIAGALIAVPFGLIDWLFILRSARAKRVGRFYGLGNGVVALMFLSSWLLRSPDAYPGDAALALSFTGIVLALVIGWQGSELVARLGLGEEEGPSLI